MQKKGTKGGFTADMRITVVISYHEVWMHIKHEIQKPVTRIKYTREAQMRKQKAPELTTMFTVTRN